MSIRTLEASVKAIVEWDDTIPLAPFIEVASSIVDEVCVPLGYDSIRLELIERWLSAHFYCVRDPRTMAESAGVSAKYEGQSAMHFQFTRYGQQAMMLDTKGGLAALNRMPTIISKITKSVGWLGRACDVPPGVEI